MFVVLVPNKKQYFTSVTDTGCIRIVMMGGESLLPSGSLVQGYSFYLYTDKMPYYIPDTE
jgi:hypothetical protein